MNSQQNPRLTGTVTRVNHKEAHGFIVRDNIGDDIFVCFDHVSDPKIERLMEGQRVTFMLREGSKGLEAIDVMLCEQTDLNSSKSSDEIARELLKQFKNIESRAAFIGGVIILVAIVLLFIQPLLGVIAFVANLVFYSTLILPIRSNINSSSTKYKIPVGVIFWKIYLNLTILSLSAILGLGTVIIGLVAVLAGLAYFLRITGRVTGLGQSCVDFKTIKHVGGCNWIGTCGVQYTDGSFGEQRKPAEGMSVCSEWR